MLAPTLSGFKNYLGARAIPFFALLLVIVALQSSNAQTKYWSPLTIGVEWQLYPAGNIFALRTFLPTSEQAGILLRGGYNIARRQNFGEHDNEEGGGPGVSIGFRYYFRHHLDGFFLAARTGLWFMNIDWADNGINGPMAKGSTFIMVVQPTVAGGYQHLVAKDKLALGASVALGFEVNVITDGAEVGQGRISLLLLSVTYKIP